MARAKGRHWVALWLVAFLVTTWLVYARQTAAIRAARELGDLRGRRANLDGHRADLERRIRAAESRAVLVPRLGARDEHGAALGGADAALEIGAVPVQVGAPAAQIAELAGRADGGGLAGVYQPRGHEERHEPEGDPVTAFSARHRSPSPRRRGAAPSGPAGSRAPRRARAGSACA